MQPVGVRVRGSPRDRQAFSPISATMVPNVASAIDFVRRIRATPGITTLPILVGGYPFNVAPELWRYVGADGSACSPDAAVELRPRLIEERTDREGAPV